MKRAAWLGLALVIFAAGCVVDDDAEGGGDEGGTSANGGANGNGAETMGGASAEGGAASSGGAGLGGDSAMGGAGGAGGAPLMGDPCVANGNPGVCADVADCTAPGYAPVPGFCPGPANIQCCAQIPEGTCDPAAMPLPNAGLVEPAGLDGCPTGMAFSGTVCVDRWEAFLVTFPDLDPVSPYFNPGASEVMAMSAPGAVPQGYINEIQASDACMNAGKRLCTNSEWLAACQGPQDFTYPYGDTLVLGECNDHRAQHPAIEYFMTSDDWIWSELDHPCLNQLPDSLALSGSFPGCVTDAGLYDMMGNLHEWTSDPAGTFRGGFYVDTMINGPGCLYATTAHDVSHFDYSTGFRCCADP